MNNNKYNVLTTADAQASGIASEQSGMSSFIDHIETYDGGVPGSTQQSFPDLLSPESEYEDDAPGLFQRLHRAAARFLGMLKGLLVNMAFAITGSIVVLPFIILWRGISVIFERLFSGLRDLVLKSLRFVFDLLRQILFPVYELVVSYNRTVLRPLMEKVRSDDATALAAFCVLLVIIVGLGSSLWLIF